MCFFLLILYLWINLWFKIIEEICFLDFIGVRNNIYMFFKLLMNNKL